MFKYTDEPDDLELDELIVFLPANVYGAEYRPVGGLPVKRGNRIVRYCDLYRAVYGEPQATISRITSDFEAVDRLLAIFSHSLKEVSLQHGGAALNLLVPIASRAWTASFIDALQRALDAITPVGEVRILQPTWHVEAECLDFTDRKSVV